MRIKSNGQAAFQLNVEIDARTLRLATLPKVKHIWNRQDELDFAEERLQHKVVPVFHTHSRLAKRVH